MSLKGALARLAGRHRRRRPTAEERLLTGETITLHLGPNLVITVNLFDGLAKHFTTSGPMDDEEGRRLLYAARYALTCPQPDWPRGDLQAVPDPDNPGVRTIPFALTHRQNQYVGDILAAYYRLITEE